MASLSKESGLISRVLPCYPGYAMGSIILNAELEIPYLEEQSSKLANEFERTMRLKEELKEGPGRQRMLNKYTLDSKRFSREIENIRKKIDAFQNDQSEDLFYREMLPIDYRMSNIEYKHRAEESENMHFIVLKKEASEAQLTEFGDHLTKMQYLPAVVELIDQISKSVLNEAHQKGQEVCLLGSFITLSKVKVFDPIVVRKEAVLNKAFQDKEKVSKYSVIVESILGGVFIGFGNRTIHENEEKEPSEMEKEKRAKSFTSTFHTFSFVSQGAIPQTQTFNLWDTYNSWKERLLLGDHSGFPIAFKVRNLGDILEENKM